MTAFREALYAIVETNKPCSVRQVYYVGAGRLWEKDRGKSRKSYNDVVRNLGVMRESGQLPWGWLVDTGRRVRIDEMYDSVADALNRMQEHYRRNLWATQPRRVEVWAESDSTSMLVESVTRTLGVGLYSCKGQAGKEFAHESAMTYLKIKKPVTILYLGDWDPSGLAIPRSLEDRLNRYSNGAVDITLQRIAVTPEQIRYYDLQTHEVNTEDSSYERFVEECRLVGLAEQAVEVEAIEPPALRDLVEKQLYGLVADPKSWNATLAYEEAEQAQLQAMADAGWTGWSE